MTLLGGTLGTLLVYATFPKGAAPETRALALTLALTGGIAGLLWPEKMTLALPALSLLLPGLPRLWGDVSGAPVLVLVALASTSCIAAGHRWRGRSSPLSASTWKWAGAFLSVAAVSALSSAVRGETIFLLLRGRAAPHFVNALGMLASDRTHEALRTLCGFVVLLLSFDAFSRLAGSARGRSSLLSMLAGAAFPAFLVAGLSPWLSWNTSTTHWELMRRWPGMATDPNALGIAVGLVAVLLVGGIRKRVPLTACALLLSVWALERSGSRSGLLLILVAAGLGCVAAFRVRPVKRAILWTGVGALGLVALLLVVILSPARFSESAAQPSMGGLSRRVEAALSRPSLEDLTSHRTVFWRAAFEMMEQEPLSGCGLSGFPFEFPVRYERLHGPIAYTDNATNALLDLGAECGLPALILALAAVIPLLVRAVDAVLAPGAVYLSSPGVSSEGVLAVDGVARAAGVACLAFAVAALTGSHIRFPEITLLVGLAAALLPPAPLERVSSDPPVSTPRKLAVLLSGAGILASLAATLPSAKASAAFSREPWVGLWGWEAHSSLGPAQRWLGREALRRILPGEERISLALDNERPDKRPVLVLIDVDGKECGRLPVPANEIRRVAIHNLRGHETVRFRFRPTFVPAELTGDPDDRELSLILLETPGRAPR